MLFILLFVYAATSKLSDVEKFKVQLGQSPMLTSIASLVVWLIPMTEFVISVLLAFARTRIIGLFAAFTLMIIFTEYIIAITQFSEYVPCSCGGILQSMSWTEHLFFNIGFVILAGIGITLFNSSSLGMKSAANVNESLIIS